MLMHYPLALRPGQKICDSRLLDLTIIVPYRADGGENSDAMTIILLICAALFPKIYML